MRIKLIIFDLDGPILDSFDSGKESFLEIRKKLIKKNYKLEELNDELFFRCWGYPGNVVLKKFLPEIKERDILEAIKVWATREKDKKIPLVKGTLKTLCWLKRKKYLTCLLTSRNINLKKHLKNIKVEKLFDLVQSWQPSNFSFFEKEKIHKNHIFSTFYKPQIQVLNQILKWAKQKRISRSEILMVDDTLVGLKCARAAKVNFLGVCTGPLYSKQIWQKYENPNKEFVIDSIAELPEWLEKYTRV